MLTTSFSPYASRSNTPLFKGKDKQPASAPDKSQSHIELSDLNPPDDLVFEDFHAAAPAESKASSSLLEKMFSGLGLKNPYAQKPGESDLSQSADQKNSLSRRNFPGLRLTVPPGTRVKKKNPSQKTAARPGESSGTSPSKNRPHGQEVSPKAVLNPIHEDDEDSILQHSLPNVGAPLDQLLTLPPQLPSLLEDLTGFAAKKASKTPASSLWVEDTTGQPSRMSISCPPSRNPEQPEEEDDGDYSDADTESLCSNTSSAFLVDDDQEVLSERVRAASRKWAKAVRNQKLGSFVAEQIAKPDIHHNDRYLDGDSDLDSEDQALFYDSDDGLSDSDSDSQSVRSVKKLPNAAAESMLTKTVQDPRFNLITKHQQLMRESKARIYDALTSQTRLNNEQRIHELQQNHSSAQLAENYRKLQTRLLQIQAHKSGFLQRLNIPSDLTMTEQVMIWQNVLNNLKLEATRDMEHLASSRKGKMTEVNASNQLKALAGKIQNIEKKQQQVDSALGLYRDLEANEDQIKNRLALYSEAVSRNRVQGLASHLDQALEAGQSDDQKLEHRHELSHLYSSSELNQARRQILGDGSSDTTRKLLTLEQALKFQAAMVDNISARLKKTPINASQEKTVAQELSQEFSRVELREAYQKFARQQDANLTQERQILQMALAMQGQKQG